MLDTIAIKLERSSYQINCPARFSPNAALMNDYKYGGKGIIRSVYNPTIEETRQGYLPRLTLFKKPYGEWGSAVWLKIEFSAPKLVFGNNFEELSDQGFEKVIGALHTALERMGIKVTRDSLVNGQITAIHFSKNIIMDRYTPCSLMLQMLEKADMSRRLDVSKSVFRNGGQMVSYHAKNFEIVFYDKIKDMEQAQKFGESRGAEKDYGEKLPYLTGIGRTDVLRMEVRLLTKKLKAVLTSLGITMPLTLKNLYSSNVSRAVLRHYWSEIVSGLYALNLEATACDELADNIRTKFPKNAQVQF